YPKRKKSVKQNVVQKLNTTICPSCNAEIETSTRTEPGMIAYLSGLVIALLGCWFGCCLIPCCIDECMDVHHTCPNCRAYLGRHRR
uniref:LITAF domain-containing protein n=1 Tax=Megaselia scalaris TaxID=36166 RepID=T1H3H3_MEGSC